MRSVTGKERLFGIKRVTPKIVNFWGKGDTERKVRLPAREVAEKRRYRRGSGPRCRGFANFAELRNRTSEKTLVLNETAIENLYSEIEKH